MSTPCISASVAGRPFTTNANVFTRPSLPTVHPASATASPSVPVLAWTLPAAHLDAAVVNRP